MRAVAIVLLLVFGQAGSLSAHEFTWKNLLLASLKLREDLDFDANVDSYMQVFRPDVWDRFRNDEFELAVKRKESIALMKKQIASFNLDETLVILTSNQFKNYDFDAKKFPVDGWSETSYFYESSYPNGSFPGRIHVYMTNPKVVDAIPMAETQAREFVKARKNRAGNVDRSVYVKLKLRIIKIKDEPEDLVAEITSVQIFADQAFAQLLHEVDLEKDNAVKRNNSSDADAKVSTGAASEAIGTKAREESARSPR